MMARTRAQDPPVTTTITRPGDARVFEDQIREYHQAHRRRYNAQRTIQRMAGHITGRTYTRSLEQQMDPQVQLRLSMQERAAIVPAEVLYHSRRDDVHHRVYVHRSEEALLVTRNQVDLSFIQPESYAQLQRSGMRFIHMGVIQVRIQILHRQEEGTLALVVFRDNRWQGDQAIFATMEIDLTNGSQLVYVIPNTMLTISDFYRNIQISVLTRGYEGWQNSEANLLITRGLVGRLSNTPNVGFAYEVQNVVDYLASHGVRALPGRSYSTRDVIGQNWTVRPSSANIPVEPTEVNTRNLLNGSISLQFTNYQATTTNHPTYNLNDEEIQSDEEEIRNHIVSVLIESPIPREEELLVKRISSLALLPQRRTAGSAGYDLAISYPQEIAARTRSMMATGICIQVPKGTYARIAPRYSAALRGLIIMGGVIDSDYRGELKIIVYNATDSDIFLDQQECIAQIILERIATPPVREVAELANTSRADQGFGSTNQICSRYLANPYCVGCQYCDDDADYHPQPIHELEPEPEIVPETSTRKGKDPLEIRLKTEEAIEEEIRQIQHQARIRAIEDHKFYEDEAYCQLTEGTWAHSIATTKRMLRDSREYRRQLQALLDVDDPNASSSSSSSNFLCVLSEENIPEPDDDDDDYFQYLQYLALQDTPTAVTSDEEFINPFAKGGGKEIIAATTADSEWVTDYPQISKLQEQIYSQEAASNYRPPADTTMNPVGYPPNRPQPAPKEEPISFGRPSEPKGAFKRKETSEWWNLPTAQQQTGALLVLPTQLNRVEDVFLRWEAITRNVVALQNFTDTQDKADFIENLLGESERLTWIQWRMNYPHEYQELVNSSDGRNGTQNIISQIRRVFLLEDPFQGSTEMQDRAYRDLERLTCNQ
ncbi:uncharacterized protein LOC122029725 isoform X1 [Zingiber officinale]|uniref:uncharacterized protein LOC122029725 isoform X1 n=1 Tax=Zingiber officinale TaxID=94328 RepID=UPI001C4AD964|nr:uncharacterized protein LOC122029725 isoform X1 [Zingiber officinale]